MLSIGREGVASATNRKSGYLPAALEVVFSPVETLPRQPAPAHNRRHPTHTRRSAQPRRSAFLYAAIAAARQSNPQPPNR